MMRPLFRMYREALPLAEYRTRRYFGHEGAYFPETMCFWGTYAIDNYGWDRTGLADGVSQNRYIRYYFSRTSSWLRSCSHIMNSRRTTAS